MGKLFIWLARAVLSALVFFAGVGPKSVDSNISEWLVNFGWEDVPSAIKSQQIDNPIALISLALIVLTLLRWSKIKETFSPARSLASVSELDVQQLGVDMSTPLMAVPTPEIERLQAELYDANKINRLQAQKVELEKKNIFFQAASARAAAAQNAYRQALTEMQKGDYEPMHRAGIVERFAQPLRAIKDAESFLLTDDQYKLDRVNVTDIWEENPVAGGIGTTGKRFDLANNVAFVEAMRHNHTFVMQTAKNIQSAAKRKQAELDILDSEIDAENRRLASG